MRLKGGVTTVDGKHQKISVIRLGRTDNMNANVQDVTLDALVKSKMNLASTRDIDTGENIGKVMAEHKSTCDEFNALKDHVAAERARGLAQSDEQKHQFELLQRKKTRLGNEIDRLRDSGGSATRETDIIRRRFQQQILDDAHVLCATLSGSGHDMFHNLKIDFETVVIDEAAQCIELSALIPLKYGCNKCIMVGDPKQLPATVFSKQATRLQYDQSLFVRMQENNPENVHLLDTQYRMHPEISSFPSKAFYDARLLDGKSLAVLRHKVWHRNRLLGPYRFFNVRGAHQQSTGRSLVNVAEIEVAMQLFEHVTANYSKDFDFKGSVAIITPYKGQLKEFKNRFVQKYGERIFEMVEFNTADAFQGRESEIVIFSCVRASAGHGIGFLADIRRMNVGITRAKSSLWILGNSESLARGEFWNALVTDAQRRDRFTTGDIKELIRKAEAFPATELPKAKKEIALDDSSSGAARAKKESMSYRPIVTPPARKAVEDAVEALDFSTSRLKDDNEYLDPPDIPAKTAAASLEERFVMGAPKIEAAEVKDEAVVEPSPIPEPGPAAPRRNVVPPPRKKRVADPHFIPKKRNKRE
jgi:senataxin